MIIVEPGDARTEFCYGSAKITNLMPEYEGNTAHSLLKMFDPALMATRIIEDLVRTLVASAMG
ncbi:hypothetical protein LL037_05560 [Clostridium estertheticum]|uniref:hypothetical protein n=1 Tax=Clostridium estertheticum TaxID=238834 RepID=UPI001C0BF6F9|nr:hypothetical protein [Clostridium estertheticum]MBU3201087.1 hypothetical protein [Clostridium estertheticum]WAG66604.1 hypothetical protein LL037_05560 [Clostridium estertheticum]